MSHLQVLRQRKEAIKATQKITSAMKMIAVSRMKKIQPRFWESQKYEAEWSLCVQAMWKQNPQHHQSACFQGYPESSKVLMIVCGSDRGLCGGFNTNLDKFIASNIAGIDEEYTIDVMAFGLRTQWVLEKSEANLHFVKRAPDIPHIAEARQYAREIWKMIHQQYYREVFLVYTQFHSMIRMEPVIRTLLPFACSETILDATPYTLDTHFEAMQEFVLEHWYTAILYRAFLSQSLCEQVARMQAMDGATRNAKDMIAQLTLQYNRQRQEAITNELMEIISGAESMKEIMNAS